ncbi:MAG: nickel-binding protein [Kiloniellales bacterium]
MEKVVLEIRYNPPIDFSRALSKPAWNATVANCLKLHRVRREVSYLALDGARQLCLFVGADAESVRIAVRSLGYKSVTIWPATLQGPVPPAAEAPSAIPNEVVVVERTFEAEQAFADLQSLEDRASDCLQLHKVAFLHSIFARDRKRMVCIYAATDAETVRRVQRQVGMSYETVWSASTFLQTAEEVALGPLEGYDSRPQA